MFLLSLFKQKAVRISSPRLGTLNFIGKEAEADLASDKAAIESYFSIVLSGTERPPLCEVLFLYCSLDDRGDICGSDRTLQWIVRDSGAQIVVIASNNSGPHYNAMSGGKARTLFAGVNLVMTVDRGGDRFARFFARLFGEMSEGTPMPVAWNHASDGPETIFVCGAGQIAF